MANANRWTSYSRSTLETDEIDLHRSTTTTTMQPNDRNRTAACGGRRAARAGVTVADGAPIRTSMRGHINADHTGFPGNIKDGFLYERRDPTLSQRWEPQHSRAMEGGREGGVYRPNAQTAEELQSRTVQSISVPQFQAPSFEFTPEIPSTISFPPNFSIDDLQGADLYAPPPPSSPPPPTHTSDERFPDSVMEQMLLSSSSSSSSSDSYHSFSPSPFSLSDSVPPGAADVQTHPMDSQHLECMATDIASIHLDDSEQKATNQHEEICDDDPEITESANQHEEICDDDPEITESANQLRRLFQQNDDGDTILHLAIIDGACESVILLLIRLFAERNLLNVPNDLHQTPLHLATIRRHDDVIAHLLRNGARRKVFDRNLDTPLHIACRNGHLPSVRALCPARTDQELEQELHGVMESSNKEGKTCLHVAIVNGPHAPSSGSYHRPMDVIQYLIEDCKVNVNLKELRRGKTILHLAVEVRSFELVHYLLNLPDSYELIVDDLTYDCYSALEMAKGMGQTRMERLFLLAGGVQPIMDRDAADQPMLT